MPLLTLPIFTDFLSVSDFGIYALATFYGVFGSGIINLGLLTVFERNFFELSSLKRKSLLFTTLIFTLFNFSLIYLLTHIFSDFISESLFKQNQLRDILPLALAFQTFKTFNQYFFIFFKNYENAKKYSYYSILESMLSTGLALIFVASASMGIYGFILGQFLGVFLVFILMFTILLYPFSNRFKFYLLKNQLRMSLPLTPRIFFGVINTQFDRYMLGLLGAVGGVGLYDIGQKIANISFSFMTSIQNIYSPQVYKKLFSSQPQERLSVGSYLTPFFYLSILACLFVGVFSFEILSILTTSEFHDAAPIVSILSLLYGFYFFAKQPQLLFAKKTGLISLLSFVSIALNITLNLPLIHYFGIIGAACATTIAGITSTGIYFYFGQKYAPIRFDKSVYLILLYFVISILTVLYFDFINIHYSRLLPLKVFIFGLFIFKGYKSQIIDLNAFKYFEKR